MSRLINNVQSFQRYLFGDELKISALDSLFNSDQYLSAQSAVCGAGHPVSQRVQVNLIIMLPGQDLPMHYDLPWFRGGANRFNLPQWLLLAMAGSGLWDEELLPQVQGVAYLHLNESLEGGEFFLYPDGPSTTPKVKLYNQKVTKEDKKILCWKVSPCRCQFWGCRRRDQGYPRGSEAQAWSDKSGDWQEQGGTQVYGKRESIKLLNIFRTFLVMSQEEKAVWEARSENGDLIGTYRPDELRQEWGVQIICLFPNP